MQLGSNTLDDYSKNLRRLFWVEFIEKQLDARYAEQMRRAAEARDASMEGSAQAPLPASGPRREG